MTNLDQMISNDGEHLFAELTAAEGANISGGTRYYVGNKTNIGINYNINGVKQYLPAGKEYTYYYDERPVVEYDSKIGSGYVKAKKYLNPGKNNFDRNKDYLFLATGDRGSVANLT